MRVHNNDAKFVYDVLHGTQQPKQPNGQAVTLFWSGGVDSTYMLMWLLCHGYTVHTIYCDLVNNRMKTKRETWARGKLEEKIRQDYPLLAQEWVHTITPICKVEVPDGSFRAVLAQMPIWLLATMFRGRYLPSNYVIAYVNGDDAVHWLPAMEKVIEGYNMLLKEEEDPVVLHFPLATVKKTWFYEALKPFYGLMTWCEMPVLRANCDCPACVRHRHELQDYEIDIVK